MKFIYIDLLPDQDVEPSHLIDQVGTAGAAVEVSHSNGQDGGRYVRFVTQDVSQMLDLADTFIKLAEFFRGAASRRLAEERNKRDRERDHREYRMERIKEIRHLEDYELSSKDIDLLRSA